MKFRFEITGIDKFVPSAAKVEEAVRAGLEAGVAEYGKLIEKGFQQETEPGGGAKWKELSAAYAAWKSKAYGALPILTLTGAMQKAAIQATRTPTIRKPEGSSTKGVLEAEITYSGPSYGPVHQFGGGRVPARPFFSLSEQGQKQLGELMAKVFWSKLK